MSTTTYTYTVNAPDCDDDHDTFDTLAEALAYFTDEGADATCAAEALTRAEEYGHTECRLGGRRYYIWSEERATAERQIVQTGIVTEEFGSTITSANHIDTYSCFELGETEHPGDGGVEWQQLIMDLHNAGILDEYEVDGVPGEIESVWVEHGPWGFSADGETYWEVTYDHDGWLAELAEASIAVLEREVVDPDGPILAVTFTGETWSPREYNFTTDGYMARWTVDTDKLDKWLSDEGIALCDGRGVSGFLRTADDETWYLGRAIREYLERMVPDYHSLMLDFLVGNGVEESYIDVRVTEAGKRWIFDHGGDPSKVYSGQ